MRKSLADDALHSWVTSGTVTSWTRRVFEVSTSLVLLQLFTCVLVGAGLTKLISDPPPAARLTETDSLCALRSLPVVWTPSPDANSGTEGGAGK